MNLDRPADAGTAVADVPLDFRYVMQHSQTVAQNQLWLLNNNARRYSVGDGEGGNGLDFASAGDPRVPVCAGGSAECNAIGATFAQRDDLGTPYFVQRLWTLRESPVAIMQGVDAAMIRAEAQLRAGTPEVALETLNAARRTTAGLADLALEVSPEAQQDQLFREKAFWTFSRGYRTGDMRRLIRQYGRLPETVFPVGEWHKSGTYEGDVTMPIPFQETNNPNLPAGATTCIDRNA